MKKVLCFAIVLALMISVSAIPVFAHDYYIESPDGEKITLDLEKSDTIENVKAKLQDETGIPPHEQRLFYNEQELEDNRTLEDYGIEKNSTIQLKLVTPANSKGVEITAEITAADFSYTMVIPTSTTLTEAKHENVLLGTTAAADGDGIVSIKDIKHPTDKVNVYYTVDLTNGNLTDGTNTIAATYKYKQGGDFTAIDGTTKVTVYANKTVTDSLVNVTADDTQWKAAPAGTYTATVTFNFEKEEVVTIADILPDDFPTSYNDSLWANNDQIRLYVNGDDLKASDVGGSTSFEIALSKVLTKTGEGQYTYYGYNFSCVFTVIDDVIQSMTVDGFTAGWRKMNGEYTYSGSN